MDTEKTAERDGQAVSSRQLIVMTFILGLGLNMLNLPALAVMEGGRDGWISMLLITAADCAALYLTLLLLEKLRGGNTRAWAAARIALGIVGFLWTSAKLLLLLGEARLFYGETVYENLNWLVFLGLLGAVIAVMGAGSARALGRLCELALPLILATAALLVLMSFSGDTEYSDVLPMLYKNSAALKSPFKLALWTGNYPVLLCLFGRVEIKAHTKLWCVAAAAVSGLIATTICFTLSASYGAVSGLISYGNNASDMNQFVGSNNFGRIDLIIFTVWSTALIIESAVYQYAAVRSLSAVIGREKPWLYSLAVALMIYLLLNFWLSCNFKLYEFATRFASVAACVVEFALPALIAAAYGIACAVKKARRAASEGERQ